MLRCLGVAILALGLNSTIAFADELPNKFFGAWSEVAAGNKQCSEKSYQIEIHKQDGGAAVSGGSFDTVCTWTDGHIITNELSISRITGTSSNMIVYSVKTQCEKIDYAKDRPGTSVVSYVRKKSGEQSDEELHISSAIDAYAGFYHRCNNVD